MRFSQYHKTESNITYRKVYPYKGASLPIYSVRAKIVGEGEG